jgi:hypothetical protein
MVETAYDIYLKAKDKFDAFKDSKNNEDGIPVFTEEEIEEYTDLKKEMNCWLNLHLDGIHAESQLRWANERRKREEEKVEDIRKNTQWYRLFGG